MKMKWVINTTAIALLIFVAFLGLAKHDSVIAAQDEESKIEGLLLNRFTTDGNADFIVRFTEQADLSSAYSMEWNARGEFVYNTLRETATRSQANTIAILNGSGYKNQTLIGGNDLYVWGGNLAVANELAALPDVYFIRATRTYYIDPVVVIKPFENVSWAGDFLAKNTLTTVGNSTDATTDWGITDTKADQFWATFGVQGDGIKVANIDTGVQWNHPALVNQFACPGDPGNPTCWKDPSNICAGGTACDNSGHGTHTMGTMVAKDDPGLTYIAGMAPDATWIACKGCESKSCSDFALITCADWILAPGGIPANRPNVVNNSWGGGGDNNWYQAKIQAWVAAGIFPAFSAGNRTGCRTLGSPGDYQESFGTTGHNSSRVHNYAQGPSAFGDEPYTKPNITAPGVSICSTIPTNGWSCGYSGTSMASPHSAGAVALLWSCQPNLIGQVTATFEALQNGADAPDPSNPTCGIPPDGEGTYEDGYGYLNVFNAGVATCAVQEPIIVVGPLALSASLLPDVITTVTLTISNNGNAALDWNIIEVLGAHQTKESSQALQRLFPTGVSAPASPKASPLVDVISDGRFEAATPNPFWTEYTTNFGTQLCDALSCCTNGGTGPPTGDWWAWFGRIDLTYEEGYVYKNVTLDPGNATLSFWSETPACDSTDDYLEVLVDGTRVYSVDGSNPACGKVGCALQTVDQSAYSDVSVLEISYHSATFSTNGDVSNFFVDDVVLDNEAVVDVPWLSETPISGTVQPGESVFVAVTFDSTGLTVGEYLASLDVTSNDPDTPVVNVPVSLTVLAQADLGITKTDAPDPVRVGDKLTYTLLATNDGPQDTTGVTVVDTLPVGVTFVSASAGCTELGGVVTCDVGAFASGVVAELTIVVTADVEGVITNTATVSGNVYDPLPDNNTVSQETTVIVRQADLGITKTDAPDPVRVGDELTYTLLVTNNGPQDATGVTVVDTLPAGVTFADAPDCTHDAGFVTCIIGDLASGAVAERTIVVVAPLEEVTLTNTAEVIGNELDPHHENNSATTDTNVTLPPVENFYIHLPLIMK